MAESTPKPVGIGLSGNLKIMSGGLVAELFESKTGSLGPPQESAKPAASRV